MLKEKILYIIWCCMAVLCIGLGTIEPTAVAMQVAMIVLAVMFFLPGVILLYDARIKKDRKGLLRIRWISIISLILTLVTMIAFILTAATGNAAADVLYDVLILVSCPMVCGQYWLISLFLWACLLCGSFVKPNRK